MEFIENVYLEFKNMKVRKMLNQLVQLTLAQLLGISLEYLCSSGRVRQLEPDAQVSPGDQSWIKVLLSVSGTDH